MSKKQKSLIEKMNDNAKNNIEIVQKYKQLKNEKKATNLDACCSWIYLETYAMQSNAEYTSKNKEKLKPIFLCKNKFCANCSYVRSKRLFVDTYKVLDNIVNVKNINFIAYHLTLTVKNPNADHYTKTLNTMNKAIYLMFKKTSKYKLKNYVLGYQCSRETTQSEEAKIRGELHPHIHILLLLNPDFTNKTRNNKMTKADILEEWNSCLKYFDATFPESTQIAMNKIQDKTQAEAAVYGLNVNLQNSAIAEVSKYPVKISDLIKMSVEHFDIMDKALHHARLITYGGIIKETRAELKIKNNIVVDEFLNEEKYELIKVQFYNLLNKKYHEEEIGELEQAIYRDLAKNNFNCFGGVPPV